MPHRGRASPSQEDTTLDLHEALKKAPPKDCIMVMGDFNEQVPGNVKDRTGKWTGDTPSKNADKTMELLDMYDLCVANTFFEPKRGATVHTYLRSKTKEECESEDFGMYVGETVACKYKGNVVEGKITAAEIGSDPSGSDPQWTVQFEDGYTGTYDETTLGKMMKRADKHRRGKQIDLILVSNRWKSSIMDCKTRWGPSIHRSITGRKSDHALLECTWKWRMRMKKSKSVPDFTTLSTEELDEEGKPTTNRYVIEFGQAVSKKLEELSHCMTDSATKMHKDMCTAISHAIETVLPTVKRSKGARRKVSEHTKGLYKKRIAMKDADKAELRKLQTEIREAGLTDFKHWVSECAGELTEANWRGDVRDIYKIVKRMEGRKGKPSKNLTADANGKLLADATAVATAWELFLTEKFKATEAETDRPAWPELPQAQIGNTLSRKEVINALNKMNNGKACGADNIPAEVYKLVPECKEILVCLIKKIWEDEEVPEEFAKAVFIMLYKNKGSDNDPTKYRCIGLLSHAYKILSQCY